VLRWLFACVEGQAVYSLSTLSSTVEWS